MVEGRHVVPAPNARVALIEDDIGMRHALERALRTAGFEPVPFASAEALLEAGTAAGAACLVLDIRLPGMSGFELHERLAGAGICPPVVYITAHDEPAARERAEKLGAVTYLLKPFGGRTLADAVARAVEAR